MKINEIIFIETTIPKRVNYKPSEPQRVGQEEHGEITGYSQALKSNDISKEHAPHPVIQKAIHDLTDKKKFIE